MVDQITDALAGLVFLDRLGGGQGLAQPLDQPAVFSRRGGVDGDQFRPQFRQAVLGLGQLRGQLGMARGDGRPGRSVFHLEDQPRHATAGLCDLRLEGGAVPALVLSIPARHGVQLADHGVDNIWVQQVGLEGGDHAGLDAGIGRRPGVLAGALTAFGAGLAAQGAARSAAHHVAAAESAAHQARQQQRGPPGAGRSPAGCQVRHLVIACADGGPQAVIDNSKIGDLHPGDGVP